MVLLPQETSNTRIRIGVFELPVVLAVQALLLRIQDQAGGMASVTTNRGEAPVEVGHANGMEIEMLEIPMLGREDRRLPDGHHQ